jgi:hypothetical protein
MTPKGFMSLKTVESDIVVEDRIVHGNYGISTLETVYAAETGNTWPIAENSTSNQTEVHVESDRATFVISDIAINACEIHQPDSSNRSMLKPISITGGKSTHRIAMLKYAIREFSSPYLTRVWTI